MNGAGADLSAARQRGRDLLQERIAAIDGNRPSGTQNGGKFVVGEFDGRLLQLTAAATGDAATGRA